MASKLTFCSANCQGLGNRLTSKRTDVIKYLKSKKFDIYFIQDTHFEKNMENIIRSEWGYECFFSSYNSRSRGVAIFLNNTFQFKVKKVISDNEGNFLILKLIIESLEYLLINIYAPNTDDPQFFKNIQTIVNINYAENIIIGGDWNLLLDNNLDGNNYKNVNNPNAKKEVSNLTQIYNLIDVWRHCHPTERKYTWHRKHNNKIIQQGRLDFFLISELLLSDHIKSRIIPGYRSDHSIVVFELIQTQNKRRKTLWKFNNQLLEDKNYIQIVHDTIKRIKYQYMPLVYNDTKLNEIDNFSSSINDQLFLEVLLMEIRSSTLAYSNQRKKKDEDTETNLIKEIEELENNKEENEEHIISKAEELENLRNNKLKGALVRSRGKWIEEGEKPTRYFLNLENRHYVSKKITKLIDKNGKEHTENCSILKLTSDFYKNLYTSVENNLENFDENVIGYVFDRKLSNEEAESLEGKINIQELGECLRHMKNNKSPGSDGFTVEFIKFFWKDLKFLICNSLNDSFKNGELSITQREGVIICIPKGNKPREFLKNWRPICLLNVIYKLCSGCIANRIKTVLPNIIHEDQRGFINNRFIGDNIRLVYDIIHHTNINRKDGIMILIDFEKAFDTLAWEFIHKILELFNFKSDLKRWIHIFLKNIKACIVANNQVSTWFEIQRGCRQGDPISPYIFTMCAEVLANMIRKNTNIKGITIGHKEFKLSQYADDTTIFLDGTKQSFETCIHTILEYAKYSGLNMNFEKTKIIGLGRMRNTQNIYLSNMLFEWNPKKFTFLGIEFNIDLDNLLESNIQNKIVSMQNIINAWKLRNLTTLGKVTIVKSLIISKITHLLTSLPSENTKCLQNVNKLIFSFIWNDKPDQIKRIKTFNRIETGGLNMIDVVSFQKSLRLTWLRRLFNDESAPWKNIVTTEYSKIKYIANYGSEFCKNIRSSIKNPFWREILNDYESFIDHYYIEQKEEFLTQPIFYNKKINISSNLKGCKLLQRKNILYLNQMINIQERRVFNASEIKTRYGVDIDFITMENIDRAIRNQKYKNLDLEQTMLLFESNINPSMSCYLQTLLKDAKGTNSIYRKFLPGSIDDKLQTKWHTDGIENVDLKQAYAKIHRSLKCTRLKWLQIRIINRILTTNKSVSKYKTEQSPKCSFCNLLDEDISHLFYDCHLVKKFWGQIEELFKEKCTNMNSLKLSRTLIIIGNDKHFYSTETFDTILTIGKMHIYRQKVRKQPLSITSFIIEIKNRHDSERYNAVLNSELNKHNRRWSPFISLWNE